MRPYKVLYLDAEMPPYSMRERLVKIATAHGIKIEQNTPINPIFFGEEAAFSSFEDEECLRAYMADIKENDIIIVDGVFRFFPSCMDSSYSGTASFQSFIERMRSMGKTLILIDHQGKSKQDSFGSAGKEIPLDGIIKLVKRKDKIDIIISKTRNYPPHEKWASYMINPDREAIEFLLLNPDEEEADAQIEELKVRKKTKKEKCMELAEKYMKEYPNLNQKELCTRIMSENPDCGGKSTIKLALKNLREMRD